MRLRVPLVVAVVLVGLASQTLAQTNGFNQTDWYFSAKTYHGGIYQNLNADIQASIANYWPLNSKMDQPSEYDVFDSHHLAKSSLQTAMPNPQDTEQWPTQKAGAVSFVAPPVVATPKTPGGDDGFGTYISNLTICPRGDVDWYQITYGNYLPALWTTIVASDRTSRNRFGGYSGINSWFDSGDAILVETHTTNANRTVYHGMSGGDIQNSAFYRVDGTNNYAASKVEYYRGQYSIKAYIEENCPPLIAPYASITNYAGGLTAGLLRANKTSWGNSFFCNGPDATQLQWALKAYSNQINSNFWTISIENSINQVVITRLLNPWYVPNTQNFELWMGYGKQGQPASVLNQTFTSYCKKEEMNQLTTDVTRFDWQMQMTWRHNGPTQLNGTVKVVNSTSAPAGYSGYMLMSERCARDYMEPLTGGRPTDLDTWANNKQQPTNFNQLDTNNFIQCWTAPNRCTLNVNDLTICPLFGYTPGNVCSMDNTTSGSPFPFPITGDPENYLVDVKDDYPGILTATVTSTRAGGPPVCLYPVWANPSNGGIGMTSFPELVPANERMVSTSTGFTTKNAVLAGWSTIYGNTPFILSINYCGGLGTTWQSEPANDYDWFRNYTEIGQLSYTISLSMKRACNSSPRNTNNQNGTATAIPFITSSILQWTSGSATDPEELCRVPQVGDPPNNPMPDGKQIAWYTFTSKVNYTYVNISVAFDWLKLVGTNWPNLKMKVYTNNQTNPWQVIEDVPITPGVPPAVQMFPYSRMQPPLQYWISIELDYSSGQQNNPFFPFRNYRLSVSIVDCQRDNAETWMNPQLVNNDSPANSFLINDKLAADASQTDRWSICGVSQTSPDNYINNKYPNLDQDNYQFSVVAKDSADPNFPGIVNVSLATIGAQYTFWPLCKENLQLTAWAQQGSQPVQTTPPGTSSTTAIASTNLYQTFIPQGRNQYWLNVRSISEGFGNYTTTISYTQKCPVAFGVNNSGVGPAPAPNQNIQIATSPLATVSGEGRWIASQTIAGAGDSFSKLTGATWFGSTQKPWNCVNPQTFKFTATRNSTRARVSLIGKYIYPSPQFQFVVVNPNGTYMQGANPNMPVQVTNFPYVWNGNLLWNMSRGSSQDFHAIVSLQSPINNWQGLDMSVELCQQDRFDWDYGANNEVGPPTVPVTYVWRENGGGVPYQGAVPQGPNRINTTSTGKITNVNWCFEDDLDRYQIYVDDWNVNNWFNNNTLRPYGFLKTWINSDKQPGQIMYTGNWSYPETELMGAPLFGPDDEVQQNKWLTSSWAIVEQESSNYKEITTNWRPQANQYFAALTAVPYDINWRYQLRCPIGPDWGEQGKFRETRNFGVNDRPTAAYRIPTPQCFDANYTFDSGLQFLCDDAAPYSGAREQFFFIKNDKTQVLKVALWITSMHFDQVCTVGQENNNWAGLTLTIWRNWGLSQGAPIQGQPATPETINLNGCQNYTQTLYTYLGMGTHMIGISRQRNPGWNALNWGTPNQVQRFYRSYRFKMTAEYCDCPPLAQTPDRHLNLQWGLPAAPCGAPAVTTVPPLTREQVEDLTIAIARYVNIWPDSIFWFADPVVNGTAYSGVIGFEGITPDQRNDVITKIENLATNNSAGTSNVIFNGFNINVATTVAPRTPSPTGVPVVPTPTSAPTEATESDNRTTFICLLVFMLLFFIGAIVFGILAINSRK